jgi:hypothetical protein
MNFSIFEKPVVTVARVAAENDIYNKTNILELAVDFGFEAPPEIKFNNRVLYLESTEAQLDINDVEEYVTHIYSTEYSFENYNLKERVSVTVYNDDKPIEIGISTEIENEFEDSMIWYFEQEGMKCIDGTFYPKGNCMNDYKLKIEFV